MSNLLLVRERSKLGQRRGLTYSRRRPSKGSNLGQDVLTEEGRQAYRVASLPRVIWIFSDKIRSIDRYGYDLRAGFAPGDRDKFKRPRAQLLADVVDQEIKIAAGADHAGKRFASDRNRRSKDHGFNARHPLAPAQFGREARKLPVKSLC
jgi:hypothetical protein